MATKREILSTGISRLALNTVVTTTILTALAVFLAFLRFVLRRRDAIGADDYILMVGLVFLLLQLVFAYLIGFLSGSGWSNEELADHPERVTWLLKLVYFPSLSYTITAVLIKTSILYSYKRIFGSAKVTRYHIYVLLGLTWSWGIAFALSTIFQCDPIDRAWLPDKPGHCISTGPYTWGNTASNFVLDWLILAVPIIPVRKLLLPRAQKVLVALSFLFGSLACIASTVRFATTKPFDTKNIGIWDYEGSLWVYLEAPLAVISCCLPFLRRLFGENVVKLLDMAAIRRKMNSVDESGSLSSQDGKISAEKHEARHAYTASEDTDTNMLEPIHPSMRAIQLTTTTTVEQDRDHM
ncbi:hypothetical protein GGR55DRAFT_695275 [Xylaria sp. FL0064]|nr:hypothetical protein GGR55DRAFT_695275 [Xylaria sp. FL0064]